MNLFPPAALGERFCFRFSGRGGPSMALAEMVSLPPCGARTHLRACGMPASARAARVTRRRCHVDAFRGIQRHCFLFSSLRRLIPRIWARTVSGRQWIGARAAFRVVVDSLGSLPCGEQAETQRICGREAVQLVAVFVALELG